MKTCTKCNIEYPATLEYFYKNGKHLKSDCKECAKAKVRANRLANPEKIKAIERASYAANPEKKKARTKAYYLANHEKVKARSAAWAKANPEKGKAYYKANPDKIRASVRKYNALKAGNIHEDWAEQQLFETYGTDCYLCNQPIDFDAPKKGPGSDYSSWPDHILATSKGGSNILENVRPCHSICNRSKGNKTYEEYILTRNSQEIVTIK